MGDGGKLYRKESSNGGGLSVCTAMSAQQIEKNSEITKQQQELLLFLDVHHLIDHDMIALQKT
jgi:hypothetical protein